MRRIWLHIYLHADYIDEVFGGKSLWPTDPYQKAVQQLLVNDFGNKVYYNYNSSVTLYYIYIKLSHPRSSKGIL